MWWWTGIVYLLVLYQQSYTQPITKESENTREVRQLHVGECCPCYDNDNSNENADDRKSNFPGHHIPNSLQGEDDCPCKYRQGDTEGASSMLFPIRMRAVGSPERPSDKKEDLKPLLHPEVDLASSVLETLREATNEEYREALARDAIRDAIKISGLTDTTLTDTAPEESRNIVTIIVKPNHDDDDDLVHQASHFQESRCIHTPLGSPQNKVGKLRVAPRPPNLFKDIFRLPSSRPVGLLHRNLMDMDSNVAASNVQEHILEPDVDQSSSKSVKSKEHVPILKLNQGEQSTSMGSDDETITNPSLKSAVIPVLPIHQSVTDKKTGSLFPRIRLGSLLFENANSKAGTNEMDGLSSNKEERILENESVKEIPYLRTRTVLEDILEKARLKKLFKLRDVELIPSRILNTPATLVPPHLLLPLIPKNNAITLNAPNNKASKLVFEGTLDHLNNEEPLDAQCSNTGEYGKNRNKHILKNEPGNTETNILDTVSNPLNTVFVDDQPSSDNSCQIELQTEQSPSSSMNPILEDSKTTINQNECDVQELHNSDSYAYKTNHINLDQQILHLSENQHEVNSDATQNDGPNESNNFETDEDQLRNIINNEQNSNTNFDVKSALQDKSFTNDQNILSENSPNTEFIITCETATSSNTFSLDNTLVSMKEKIMNKLQDLHHIKDDLLNSYNKEKTSGIELPSPDCLEEKSDLLPITLDTKISSDDNIYKENKITDFMTMYDLQKMSESMLRKEKEPDCSKIEMTADETEIENLDLKSTNPQIEDAHKIHEYMPNANNDRAEENCQRDLSKTMSNQAIENIKSIDGNETYVPEMNTDASDNIVNKLKLPHEKINSHKNLELPSIFDNIEQLTPSPVNSVNILKTKVRDFFKLDYLPKFDDIKLKPPKLDNNDEVDVHEDRSQEQDCISELKSSMATDASTTKFQVQRPPLDIENFDTHNIFRFRPIPMPHSKTRIKTKDSSLSPKFKLASPLSMHPNNINANNINTLETGLTRTVSEVIDNVSEKYKAKFDELRDKMMSNPHRLFKAPSLIENFNDQFDLSDIKHHGENPVKNIQQKLKATPKNGLNLINPISTSHNILQAIVEKHDDINDKIRAVHIDLADRLDSMRNNIINPTHLSDNRSISKNKSYSHSIASKDRQSSRKKPKQFSARNVSPINKPVQKQATPFKSQRIEHSKLKMPYAASMPVPKTIEVPKLIRTPANTNMRTLQNVSNLKNNLQSTQPPPVQSSTILAKQAIKDLQDANKLFKENQINPFKNSKVTVSFSTSPRPQTLKLTYTTPLSRTKSTDTGWSLDTNSRNIDNHRFTFKHEDSNGALSETKPINTLVSNTNIMPIQSTSVSERDSFHHLTSSNSNSDKETTKHEPFLRHDKPVKSWPQVSENLFLAKVKDAVSSRLNNNLKNRLGSQVLPKTSLGSLTQVSPSHDVDMLRSASDVEVNNDGPLKENVPYKCKMVCTRE